MLVDSGTLLGNRYLLREQIAEGEWAGVYSALDTQLDRQVAVEMLSGPASLDPTLCDSFQRHQRMVSAIHHPRVLETYDAGEWQGRPYYVTEHDAALAQPDGSNIYDVPAALGLTRQAAEGLAFCRGVGLDNWPFSPRQVRISSGAARLAVLFDTGPGKGATVSRREADDPQALAALLRLLLNSGAGSAVALPMPVSALLARMDSQGQGSFASAGEVAEAILMLEMTSNDYTQTNVPVVSPSDAVSPPTPPDLQRTASLAEAPTLAVRAAAPVVPMPAPYVPLGAMQNGAVAAGDDTNRRTEQHGSRPYLPAASSSRAGNLRRRAALLLLPLLLLLGAGALYLSREPSEATSPSVLPTPAKQGSPSAANTPPAAALTVPNLLGMTLEEAGVAAEQAGIAITVGDPVPDASVPIDRVALQDPAPGTSPGENGAVRVALSLGPPQASESDLGVAPNPKPSEPPSSLYDIPDERNNGEKNDKKDDKKNDKKDGKKEGGRDDD